MVMHACCLSYVGDTSRRATAQAWPWVKSTKSYLKITKQAKKRVGVTVQVVEHMPKKSKN
jgi:hypothetical protein